MLGAAEPEWNIKGLDSVNAMNGQCAEVKERTGSANGVALHLLVNEIAAHAHRPPDGDPDSGSSEHESSGAYEHDSLPTYVRC